MRYFAAANDFVLIRVKNGDQFGDVTLDGWRIDVIGDAFDPAPAYTRLQEAEDVGIRELGMVPTKRISKSSWVHVVKRLLEGCEFCQRHHIVSEVVPTHLDVRVDARSRQDVFSGQSGESRTNEGSGSSSDPLGAVCVSFRMD